MTIRRSVVVLSGGLDSATAALKAAEVTDVAALVHFDFGQNEGRRECFDYWAKRLDTRGIVLPVPAIDAMSEAIARPAGRVAMAERVQLTMLEPGRNLVYLTLAASVAVQLGAGEVWTGICQNDHAAYPDRRPETIEALAAAIRRGFDKPLQLITPFSRMSKSAIWGEAERTGYLSELVEHTHGCARGDRRRRMPWGYGCGRCLPCDERRTGFNQHFGDRR